MDGLADWLAMDRPGCRQAVPGVAVFGLASVLALCMICIHHVVAPWPAGWVDLVLACTMIGLPLTALGVWQLKGASDMAGRAPARAWRAATAAFFLGAGVLSLPTMGVQAAAPLGSGMQSLAQVEKPSTTGVQP